MSDGMEKERREFFGSLRFMGERFKSANLPVDLLDSIKSYQEILYVFAEDIWRERNPDSKRLPRGFRKNLSLSFSHVEEGSARAILKSDSSVQSGILEDEFAVSYMALAQTKFLELSRAANEDKRLEGISPSAKKPLLSLISNLKDGEGLEVRSYTGKDQRNPSVKYSTKTMKALVDAASEEQVRSIEGLGIVRAILDSSEEIEVLSEHGVFRLPVPSAQLRGDCFPIAAFVEFGIQAIVSSNGQVKKVIETGEVSRVESNADHHRFLDRLKVLTDLKEGWKDGAGKSIGCQAARHCHDLSGFICDIYSDVSIFPEIDGSIKIEFEFRNLEISVICKDKYIHLEVFDESDADPKEKTFRDLTPKLLADLSNLEGFVN